MKRTIVFCQTCNRLTQHAVTEHGLGCIICFRKLVLAVWIAKANLYRIEENMDIKPLPTVVCKACNMAQADRNQKTCNSCGRILRRKGSANG